MKILIPLTILVLSFIIYYFFNTKPLISSPESTPLERQNIDLEKKKETLTNNYIPSLASIKIDPHPQTNIQTEKAYLTLADLRNKNFKMTKPSKKEEVSQKHYDQIVFHQLKTILKQSSATYNAKKRIVLNSPISSILTSQNAREKFKIALSTNFGLDDETIRQEFKQNRTVWDWVVFLSP